MRGLSIVGLALIGCGPTEEKLECSYEYQIVSYVDADGDGTGDDSTEERVCELTGNRISLGGDCDDADAAISPKAVEVCDGIDQDCDTEADDGLSTDTWYLDEDDDGFGGADKPVTACAQPSNATKDTTDCDDDDAAVFPGANEICDGADNNCNSATDDEDPKLDLSSTSTFFTDGDGDGFGGPNMAVQACENPDPTSYTEVGGDCDDVRSAINPGALEACDGRDNDCDTLLDDADPSVDPADLVVLYEDADEDGFGNDLAPIELCDLAPGYADIGGDCDDNNALITGPSLWVADDDGDGWGQGPPVSLVPSCTAPYPDTAPQPPEDDCDDTDADINPDEIDNCEDGVDQDCSGADASCTMPSCQDYKLADPTLPDGVYEVEPTPGSIYDVWCDMTTDGGGWTLVMSSGASGLPTDGKGPYHNELTTMFPVNAHLNPWDGMKPAVDATHDIRFACRTSAMGPLAVDLSFYDVDWYDQIAAATEATACFYTGGVVGVGPERKNNVTGALLALGNTYNSGSFEGEDSCSDAGDFTVDFDDRGMDSNQNDGTDWGSDDSSSKCGTTTGNSFYILVR